MNVYAIVTTGGNTVILFANDVEDARRKYRRNHNTKLKSIRLVEARDPVPKPDLSFLSYRSDISTSKMWITRDFEIIPLPQMNHRDFLLNSENRAKFRIEIPDAILVATTQDPERDTAIHFIALQQGFTRVNYEFNGSKITFEAHEMTQRMNRKNLLGAVDQIMAINRELIDEFQLHILNDKGIAIEQLHLSTKEFEDWRSSGSAG